MAQGADVDAQTQVALPDPLAKQGVASQTGFFSTKGRTLFRWNHVPVTDELLDVMVNGKLIARGEVVAQGDRFGLKIVELAGAARDAAPPLPVEPAAGEFQ